MRPTILVCLLLLSSVTCRSESVFDRPTQGWLPPVQMDPMDRALNGEPEKLPETNLDDLEKMPLAKEVPRKYPTPYESIDTVRTRLPPMSERWVVPEKARLPIPGELNEAKSSLWSAPIETSPPLPTGTW